MKTLIALFIAVLATSFPALAKTPGEIEIGGLLRDAKMQGLNGPARNLADFRGKPLIINVWASWCGPCRAEMGSLERLSRRFGNKFTVIGISTDDYPDAARGFLQKSNTTFANYIDNKLLLENMLGADRIPLTLLIDANGRVLAKYYGAKPWDSPEAIEVIGKLFRLQL